MDVLVGMYLMGTFWLFAAYYKDNRLKMEMIEELVKQNDLLGKQNNLMRGVIKKFGLDVPE
jgi:hypothetical protein